MAPVWPVEKWRLLPRSGRIVLWRRRLRFVRIVLWRRKLPTERTLRIGRKPRIVRSEPFVRLRPKIQWSLLSALAGFTGFSG